jgi:prepilin-type N-terminal cleavage/methylation domain-containing protein
MNPTTRVAQRGLTLTELTVVMVLAGIVTIGLVTFYLHSQGLWIDASAQSMTQRDATLLLEEITAKARLAQSASVINESGTSQQRLILFSDASGTVEAYAFRWSASDSLVHLDLLGQERPNPVVHSKVAVFNVDTDGRYVYVTRLKMAANVDQPIEVQSSIRLYNRS